MSGTFTGKVAVVTGAGSGIGLATARALATDGATVVIADVDAAAAEKAAASIGEAGEAATAMVTDVASSSSVAGTMQGVLDRYGRLDILVNNAGISRYGPRVAEIEEEVFDRIVAVNLRGVWLGMKYAIPAMLAGGGGNIVNIASNIGLVGRHRGSGAYSATKHGVIGLTRTAALEYGREGVRVNAVCPGGTDTPISVTFRATFTDEEWAARTESAYPSTGRYGLPEEIAAVVCFLCSPGASNIHGAAIPVDGGYTAQ